MSARTSVAAFALIGAVGLTVALPGVHGAAPAEPTATPQGEIGDPITGTPAPTGWLAPAIHSHRKHHRGQPPREHITQPPTDTAP